MEGYDWFVHDCGSKEQDAGQFERVRRPQFAGIKMIQRALKIQNSEPDLAPEAGVSAWTNAAGDFLTAEGFRVKIICN